MSRHSPARFHLVSSAILCVLASTTASHAAVFVRGLVPDWNQPYWHGANDPTNGGPVGGPPGPWQFWCTPTSAANVIGYWEDRRGHAIADGAAFPSTGVVWPNWPAYQDYQANGFNRGAVPAGTADDLGWYFDTNRRGDPAQGNPGGAMNHIGTQLKDISRPGLGLNKFFAARGITDFRVRTQGVGYADPGLPPLTIAQAWEQIVREINADRPVMVCFKHWCIGAPLGTGSDNSAEGSLGWTYVDMLRVGACPDPWGNGESWDASNVGPTAVGHCVTVVGYIVANSTDDIGPTTNPPLGPTHWVIVHDNAGPTPRNLAVPFVNPLVNPTTPWLANTLIRCAGGGILRFGDPEVVDAAGDTGRYVELVVDDVNQPHIVYADQTNQDVQYAVKNGAAWTLENVDTVPNAVVDASIALSTDGSPRVAYAAGPTWNPPNWPLKYAYRSAGGWVPQDVAAGNVTAVSLAMTTTGLPHIAYLRNNVLQLAWHPGGIGNWTFTQVDAAAGNYLNAKQVSLAMEPDGTHHIAYPDEIACGALTVGRLKHATDECGAWSVNVLENNCGTTNFSVGQFPSIALDAFGGRYISHYTLGAQLRTRRRVDGCDLAVWNAQTVDPNIAQGSTVVRYDGSNQPLIAYWGACPAIPQPRVCLKLARWTGGVWLIDTVFDPGVFAATPHYLGMDLDSADRPHVAFYGPDLAILRFVRAYYVGDVDDDGCIDRNDRPAFAALLLDPSAGTPEQRGAADCNGDGSVNGDDLQCLLDLWDD